MMHRFRAVHFLLPHLPNSPVYAFQGVNFPPANRQSCKMTTNSIISVADYYGTKGARELVHRVKNNDVEAIAIMARALAVVALARLPADSVLVPVPSHTGHATNTLQLAKQISQLTGLPVLDIVKGRKRAPWYTLKLDALVEMDGSNQFFGFHLISDIKPYNPVIVDTVIDTGLTTKAIVKLFNKAALILTYGQVIRST